MEQASRSICKEPARDIVRHQRSCAYVSHALSFTLSKLMLNHFIGPAIYCMCWKGWLARCLDDEASNIQPFLNYLPLMVACGADNAHRAGLVPDINDIHGRNRPGQHMPQFKLLKKFGTLKPQGHMGIDHSHHYKVPWWLTIANGMLNRQCGDGQVCVFICTGAPGWYGTSPD